MSILPALVEGDIQAFARGITEVQRANGDHFSAVQGGRFRSPAVAEILLRVEVCRSNHCTRFAGRHIGSVDVLRTCVCLTCYRWSQSDRR